MMRALAFFFICLMLMLQTVQAAPDNAFSPTFDTIEDFNQWLTDKQNTNGLNHRAIQQLAPTVFIRTYLPPTVGTSALTDFYNATEGVNWTKKTNWMDISDTLEQGVCDWHGIRCNYTLVEKIVTRESIEYILQNEITSINLQSNNLTGQLPNSIAELVHLKGLLLSNNKLDGELPDSLWQLVTLEQLYLGRNLFIGGLSAAITNLTQLVNLHINHNLLDGPLPEFTGLLKVQGINLSSNQFTGSIPQSISELTDLAWLDLTGNNLSGSIPDTIGNLINLISLSLQGNQLSDAIPESITHLTSLTSLQLQANQLTGIIPSNIGH